MDAGSRAEFLYGLPCYYDVRAKLYLYAVNKKAEIRGECLDLFSSLSLASTGDTDAKAWIEDFLERYQFDYVIIDAIDSMESLRTIALANGYSLGFQDETGVVLKQDD